MLYEGTLFELNENTKDYAGWRNIFTKAVHHGKQWWNNCSQEHPTEENTVHGLYFKALLLVHYTVYYVRSRYTNWLHLATETGCDVK